jgi:hypothetical protein
MPKNGSALRSGFCRHPLVKADIHFPVDRVLLRDAARTLVQALLLIREHGLKHRSGSLEALIRSMNKLCMEMTHTRKKTKKDETRGRGRSLIPVRQPPHKDRGVPKNGEILRFSQGLQQIRGRRHRDHSYLVETVAGGFKKLLKRDGL